MNSIKIKYFLFIATIVALIITVAMITTEKVNWTWTLEQAAMYNSVLSITNENNVVSKFELACNLTDAINKTKEDETSATISVVLTKTHPKGLLVISCNVGAHSEQIIIINPNQNSDKIVFKKTGSYYVDWKITDQQLVITYDKPCTPYPSKVCENRFTAVKLIWP